jgi:hypothetical protein
MDTMVSERSRWMRHGAPAGKRNYVKPSLFSLFGVDILSSTSHSLHVALQVSRLISPVHHQRGRQSYPSLAGCPASKRHAGKYAPSGRHHSSQDLLSASYASMRNAIQLRILLNRKSTRNEKNGLRRRMCGQWEARIGGRNDGMRGIGDGG